MKRMRLLVFASFVLMIAYIITSTYIVALDSKQKAVSDPFGVDYAIFYAAGQIVLDGTPTDIYNTPVHHRQLEQVLGRTVPVVAWWLYPPTFLLAIVPLSILPYYLSLAIWIVLTLVFAIISIRSLLPKDKFIALLACGFPGILMNLRWGQNAFLTTGLLGFGISFLETNPVLSGLMFGLLTYKPQTALFPLLILVLIKKWRVLAWTTVFASCAAILSGFLFGFETWISFFHSMLQTSSAMMNSVWEGLTAIQPSFYSAFRLAGVNGLYLSALTGIIGIIVIITVLWVWRKTNLLTLKGSSLVLGILLASPYYIQYDLMLLSIPLVLMTYDCFEHGCHLLEATSLVLLFFLPLYNWPLVRYTGIQVCPLILSITMVIVLLRVRKSCALLQPA